MRKPNEIKDSEYRYDAFDTGKVLLGKKKNHLPAMGWNSWNAFGSGNTEALTKIMADKMVELGLDKCGYKYVVLDDGCYLPKRVDGLLANEPVKFPNGFKNLSDYVHSKGLKFGMYNDIGTNLCAGAEVGTCGHETEDARSYIDWGVDFLKVDNCYYLWDNATFSDPKNADFVYTPGILGIRVTDVTQTELPICELTVDDAELVGEGIKFDNTDDGFKYAYSIGTFDGTGPAKSPIGAMSGELKFTVNAPKDGLYNINIDCYRNKTEGIGRWIQLAIDDAANDSPSSPLRKIVFDDILEEFEGKYTLTLKDIPLRGGNNQIYIMNHRRQENTLSSYARLLEGLNKANPDHDVIYSICEWGKTQPHCWGYKVGDSWRILNDITFNVGSDGDPGKASWSSDYTPGVAVQYNKCVIMDEFCGLDKGWNDPDMLMIGMDGLDNTMNRTHMTMWCMMNAPLMLGLDLRRVLKGDELWNIIANDDLIAVNQDPLGIAAKRVMVKMNNARKIASPSTEYITDNDRIDVLVKPLFNGDIALSVINLSEKELEMPEIDIKTVINDIADKMGNYEAFTNSVNFSIFDFWTKKELLLPDSVIKTRKLLPHDTYSVRISPANLKEKCHN